MTSVLLYGSETEKQITNTLIGAIRAVHKSALHITPKTVALIPPGVSGPDFLILDNLNVPNVQLGKGIVVFKPGLSGMKGGNNIPNDFFAIADPENSEAVEMLEKNCMHTITCGLSQKDSITFSSIGTDSAVVSLQRGLITLDGKITEPLELPIEFGEGHSQYALLASVAVLFLAGDIDNETKIKI